MRLRSPLVAILAVTTFLLGSDASGQVAAGSLIGGVSGVGGSSVADAKVAAAPPPTSQATQPARPIAVEFGPPMFGDFPVRIEWVTDRGSVIQGPAAPARGHLKIGENESPVPQDRLFVNYNYYSGFQQSIDTVHREIFGFEKTLFDEAFSVGLRVPLYQAYHAVTVAGVDPIKGAFDLTLLLKGAVFRDRAAGRALSAGLGITLPTSNQPRLVDPTTGATTHSTVLQPLVGYAWRWNDVFVQGFTSFAAPTDSEDAKLLFSDIGIGWWAYERGDARLLTAIAPTAEVHFNTQTNRDPNKQEFITAVNLTGGATFIFRGGYSLGFAFGTNARSPQLFKGEAIVRLNHHF